MDIREYLPKQTATERPRTETCLHVVRYKSRPGVFCTVKSMRMEDDSLCGDCQDYDVSAGSRVYGAFTSAAPRPARAVATSPTTLRRTELNLTDVGSQ